jgi:hypothetical protein
MSIKKRLFWILWAAGVLGVLSFLFVDLSALIAAVPRTPGEPPVELPPLALLKVVSLIQPAVLVTIAVVVGVWLAERVGLHAPAAEALARRDDFFSALKPQILPGVLAGLASGVAIVATWVIAKPFLTSEFIARAQDFNKFLPHITRFLYGGFTEEVLLRWGVMTFLVWLAWGLLQKGEGRPKAIYVVAAIGLSAVIFGAGHLPIASMLSGGLTLPLTIYVITANSIFGIAAGFLYWRQGLESAMIAHIFTHVVLILAIYLAF